MRMIFPILCSRLDGDLIGQLVQENTWSETFIYLQVKRESIMRQICFYAMLKLPDSGEKLFINRTKADEDEKT